MEEENTIVCDGKGGIRPHIQTFRDPLDEKCLEPCIIEHEEVHRDDFLTVNRNVCGGTPKVPDNTPLATTDPRLKKDSELKAYEKEKACLEERLKREGPRGECRPYLEARSMKVNDTLFKIRHMTPEELIRNGRR